MADVLNQAEIDKLLGALASGEVSSPPENTEKAVKPYNFRRPNKFNRDQMRAVQMLHESFARYLTSTLSTMTRSMVSVEISNVEQVPYEEFVRSVISPTTLAILDVIPLNGKAILEVNQILMFALIDRMLGGKGLPINSAREFTDLERVIVDRTLSRILKELDASWKTIEENIHFSLFGKESNPFFVQIVPKAEMVLLVNIKAQVGMVEERMNLCLPFHTLESVMERFNPQEWFVTKDQFLSEEDRARLSRKIEKVSIDLTAELTNTTLTLEELSTLSPGDVINLGTPITEGGTMHVGPIPKFYVTFGSNRRGNLCANIVDILPSESSSQKKG